MTHHPKLEAAFASGITATAGIGEWLAHADAALVVATHVAMLAWWLRLWIKDPNRKPPTK